MNSNPDTKYTALIPFDEAFRRWYPIDWGFNPFEAPSFVRETLLDHFLVGQAAGGEGDLSSLQEGKVFK